MAEHLAEVTNNYVSPEDAKEELLNECESVWKHMEECQSKLLLLGTETVLESDVKLSLLTMRVKALTAEYHQWQKRSPECQEKVVKDTSVYLNTQESRSFIDPEKYKPLRQVELLHLLGIISQKFFNSDRFYNPDQAFVRLFKKELEDWKNLIAHTVISTNPDVLLELGKEELQKVKNDLEMVLSTIQSKNKQLEEDLKREQQWHKEQEQILDTLTGIEEETKIEVQQLPKTSLTARAFQELQNKMSKLRTYKEELLDALGEFLEEHFPLPERGRSAIKKNSSEEPAVELITLNEILEILIAKLMSTPHEPYVTIDDSFWPPYIELLLRYGIALRHPEDPNRMRLEAFHM